MLPLFINEPGSSVEQAIPTEFTAMAPPTASGSKADEKFKSKEYALWDFSSLEAAAYASFYGSTLTKLSTKAISSKIHSEAGVESNLKRFIIAFSFVKALSIHNQRNLIRVLEQTPAPRQQHIAQRRCRRRNCTGRPA